MFDRPAKGQRIIWQFWTVSIEAMPSDVLGGVFSCWWTISILLWGSLLSNGHVFQQISSVHKVNKAREMAVTTTSTIGLSTIVGVEFTLAELEETPHPKL